MSDSSIQRGNISQVAKELGVSDNQQSKWRKELQQYQHNSFPCRGVERLTDEQREIKELRKQLKDNELYLEILKTQLPSSVEPTSKISIYGQ